MTPAPTPSALERQADALLHQGHPAEAEALYRQVLANEVPTPAALGNLAALWCLQGRWREAIPLLQRQLRLVPSHPVAWRNLGLAQLQLGNSQAAIEAYRQAVASPGGGWESWFGLANACREHGDHAAAIEAYRRCLELCPGNADAANNLGGVLQAKYDLPGAIAAYRQAIATDPTRAEAFNNLGIVLREIGNVSEAINAHQRAVALEPGMALAHANLGIALWAANDAATAQAAFAEAARLGPNDLGLALSALAIHEVYPSTAAIQTARQRFTDGLTSLLQRFEASTKTMIWDRQPCVPSYYLSYHNQNDRPYLELLHLVISMALRPPEPTETTYEVTYGPSSAPCHPVARVPTRIGLVSGLCKAGHVIGRLYEGLLRNLEAADDMETILFHLPFGSQQLSFEASPDHTISHHELSPRRERAEEQIRAMDCDLLFYLDVDMEPAIWSLANTRLAPVQVTSWGNPNTTGMASMDYYLSAAAIEPPEADTLYTETLIRFSRLPCIYSPPPLEGIKPDRAGFQLSSTELLIGIPQSLFKFHPDYDAVLERIVQRVPNSRLVLLEGSRPHHTARLKQRWAQIAPQLLDQTVFLPRLSRERYLTLLDTVDILLDPFFFGSGNSFYEAMAIGTPLVTLPGQFMRGRIVAGGYKQMGLGQQAPIATSADNYIEWVVRLAHDPELRSNLKASIQTAAQQHLFNDQMVAAEFITFIKAAIAANRSGQRLSSDWHPSESPDIRTQKAVS